MGRVLYDSKRIIPAPLASINKDYRKLGNGVVIGKTYTIVLQGELVAWKGSPSSSGTFHTIGGYPPDENILHDSRLGAILRKQEALRDLFSSDGRSFEIQSLDATQPMKCNPRVVSVDFAQGIWHDVCPYTITLESDEMYPMEEDELPYPSAYLLDASETWSIDTDETAENLDTSRTYKLTHSISAVGKRFFDDDGHLVKEPWQHARDYAHAKLGFNTTIALSSGLNNIPSYYAGFNHIRSENIDIAGGGYSTTEAWILTSGNYIEDFNITTNESIGNGLVTVAIQGNIQGLETRNANFQVTSTKYSAANARFVTVSGLALSRAQAYSGKTLNIEPAVTTFITNPVAGVINYTFEYDDRPSRIVTGTKSEVISITNVNDVDAVATIPVLGRTRGPVLQELSTKQVCQRTLNIELFFPANYIPTGTAIANRIQAYNPRIHSPQSTDIASVITAANPAGTALNNIGATASDSYVVERSETWNPSNLQYSLNISWIYE
jgi:hypothetical protein